jgi:hypothetical protein
MQIQRATPRPAKAQPANVRPEPRTPARPYVPVLRTREDILAYRIFLSTNPADVNYVPPEKYTLLLDVADFLTPENIQTYFVDFYQNKKPCCARTLSVYFTKILPRPDMSHLAHYLHNGKMIHVMEWYNKAMASERRSNNDVFGRSVVIQARVSHTQWVPVTVCQIMFCRMIHKMHLFDHIHEFLDEIRTVMRQEGVDKPRHSTVDLKQTQVTPTDFHMTDRDEWKIKMGIETNPFQNETHTGIDFYMC